MSNCTSPLRCKLWQASRRQNPCGWLLAASKKAAVQLRFDSPPPDSPVRPPNPLGSKRPGLPRDLRRRDAAEARAPAAPEVPLRQRGVRGDQPAGAPERRVFRVGTSKVVGRTV